MTSQQSVLFLCTNNSCRSQMAEGLLRSLAPERYRAFSAGARATFVHPFAILVMDEIGIDISGQKSKSVDEFSADSFDYVITVCGDYSKEVCPFFPGEARERLSWNFPDPATAPGSEDEVLKVFRDVRDSIKETIQRFIKNPS